MTDSGIFKQYLFSPQTLLALKSQTYFQKYKSICKLKNI